MQVALRERYLDAVSGELPVDRAVKLVHDETAFDRLVDPAQQIEVETRITEQAKANSRFGMVENAFVGRRDLFEDLYDLVDICAVGNTDAGAYPVAARRTAGFIDNCRVAHDTVGNGYFNIVAR